MARTVYISANEDDEARAQALGVGFLLTEGADSPFVLVTGNGQAIELAEPTTAQAVAAALQPILDAETAAAAVQAAASTNQATLLQKAASALAANQTYLAIPGPTTAQAVAQVKALTAQVNVLIRLAAQLFDSTAGT